LDQRVYVCVLALIGPETFRLSTRLNRCTVLSINLSCYLLWISSTGDEHSGS
jgi:hypothetical protein